VLTLGQKAIAIGTLLFLVAISFVMLPVFGVIALILAIPMGIMLLRL
jgi:hypothetical protein